VGRPAGRDGPARIATPNNNLSNQKKHVFERFVITGRI